MPADAHGCPGCPHPGTGPAIGGSPNVNVNKRPALRVDDPGIHAACCGPNLWNAKTGSATVFINGKKAHRLGDMTKHCGGMGKLIEGSGDVIVGDSGGGGGGSGGGRGAATSAATAASAAAKAKEAEEAKKSQNSGGGSNGQNSNTQGGPGGQNAPNAADKDAPDDPDKPKPKKPTKWKLVWQDGKAVKGFKSKWHQTAGFEQDLSPDGSGAHTGPEIEEGTEFHVEIYGTTSAEFKLQDEEGKAIPGVHAYMDRAFGPEVSGVTDGGGKMKAWGFVEEEPFDLSLAGDPAKLEGKVEDFEGKPVPNAKVKLIRGSKGKSDTGPNEIDVTTDANGRYRAEGFEKGEWIELAVVEVGVESHGKFVDEKGKPMAGVMARIHYSGSREPELTMSDSEGKFTVKDLLPGELFSLEVVSYG